MSVIRWRESYNTGIEQFDEEHHKIVDFINSMFVAIRDKAEQQEVEKVLAGVVSYTEYHFDNEEAIMAASNYPELEEHRKKHEKLKAETVKFKVRLEEDFKEGSRKFYVFLREWFTDHIMECDMKYSVKLDLLNEKKSQTHVD